MSYWQAVILAARALKANLLRTLLTMLGIVIGVGAVIAMVAIGGGARMQVAERIQSLGTTLLVIVPGSQRSGGVSLGAATRHTLMEDDATAIGREIPLVTHAAPKLHGRAQVVFGNRNWSTAVSGVTLAFFEALDWSVQIGGLFSPEEEQRAAKVAIIGTTVAAKLFGDASPLGKKVRIRDVPFVVVGLLERKGQDSSGNDTDDNVYVPLSTARLRLFGGKHTVSRQSLDAVIARVSAIEDMPEAAEQIRGLLRQRHRLPRESPDDFRIVDIASVQAAHTAAARTMGLLLLAIASVSLLVGGISIMNIMLVSITERTREIGLRLALGARRRDVRNQFLIEAITISAVGGVVGIWLGLGIAIAMAEVGKWPIVVGVETTALAFSFAAAVGVLSGLYPALKASLLDPIEALRFE